MLCKKCGNNIENSNKFCGSCGEPIEKVMLLQESDTTATEKSLKLKSKKQIIFLSSIATVALAIIITFVIFLCTDMLINTNPYTMVIDKRLQAIQDIDVKKLMEILPDDYIQYILDTTDSYSNYDDMLLDYEDNLWQINRQTKKKYGTDFKIVYEIYDEKHCKDSKELSKLTDKFNKKYNGKSEITEVVQAVVNTEIKSPEKDEQYNEETMYFISIEGKWYLDTDKLSESVQFE